MLLSFGMTVFANCAGAVSRYNHEAQKMLLLYIQLFGKVAELSETVARKAPQADF